MATDYLTHVSGTIVQVPDRCTLTMTKSGSHFRLRIDTPNDEPIHVEAPQYLGWSLFLHTQSHKDYPRWYALAKKMVGNTASYVNAEGKTADEAVKNLKALLERKR